MNIAPVKNKLSQVAFAIARLALPFKNWRAKRKLQGGFAQLKKLQEAAPVNVGERVLVLCRWCYGAQSLKPTLRVDIFVTFSARRTSAGFEAASQYDARAYEFQGMVQDGYGDQKEKWQLKFEENFDGPTGQATAKQHIAMGHDPMLQLFKGETTYQTLLANRFPELASRYDALVISGISIAPNFIPGESIRL